MLEIDEHYRINEFRSKVACKNDIIQLECNPYSRIAIYSASFGRTEYESIQCPQPQGVKEETCLVSYATETVMQICHGRRRCNLSADTTTFGSPCSPQSRIYLKVVYTCVPKQVLKDRYESDIEPDEVENFGGDENDIYDEDQFYKESEAIPKLQSNFTRVSVVNISSTMEPDTTQNPIVTQPKGISLEDSQNRLYLYLIIAGSVGVLLCIILVVARVVLQKRRSRSDDTTSSPKGETTISNGFNDSISEIDADIDLATPVPVPSVSKSENYITYGPATNLYGSLGPSNVSHTSTTMLLPTNSLVCARQSPDIIGVANTFVGQPPLGGSSAIGAVVPITSLAQYTTAPTTFHPAYIMDHEGILRRPNSTQPVHALPQHPQSGTFHYDGTAPRTLSSGVAQNPQFYYG
ncbi:unnamed protein product [Hermetia illucens]|uniref:SUEL-type lectin domain-containing protein n=1 Tax=Hermetia illucens TaxID=343691 RepID=A0A7R8V5B3_HERIL|nr:unnamed protein product [Hermetia illucens]